MLGDPLVRGLTEISRSRPSDPIAFLAKYLHSWSESRERKLNTIVITVSADRYSELILFSHNETRSQ